MKLKEQIKRLKKLIRTNLDHIIGVLSMLIGLLLLFSLIMEITSFLFSLPPFREHELTLGIGIFTTIITLISFYCGYYIYEKTKKTGSFYYYSAVYTIVVNIYWWFIFFITEVAYQGLDIFEGHRSLIILDWILVLLGALSFFVIARYAFRKCDFPTPMTCLKWTCVAFVFTMCFLGLAFLILTVDHALMPKALQGYYLYDVVYYDLLRIFYYISIFILILAATAFIFLLLFTILYAGYEAYGKERIK